MDLSIEFDLEDVVRQLNLPAHGVRQTVELLDEGNTVPFITRYRKDQTGGFDEQQIRAIQQVVDRTRSLIERKESILRAIQSRGQLTDDLLQRIRAVRSAKVLEDIYLPYKTKKQTRATLARQRGLEPLANAIWDAEISPDDVTAEAEKLINPDQKLVSVDKVLDGVRDLIAERLGERVDLRQRLREKMRATGILTSSKLIEELDASDDEDEDNADGPAENDAASDTTSDTNVATDDGTKATTSDTATSDTASANVDASVDNDDANAVNGGDRDSVGDATGTEESVPSNVEGSADEGEVAAEAAVTDEGVGGQLPTGEASAGGQEAPLPATGRKKSKKGAALDKNGILPLVAAGVMTAQQRRRQRRDARRRKRKKLEASFKDYFDFRERLNRIPPHRVLAINRGERTRVLRVKIEYDAEAMHVKGGETLISADHPHASFLQECLRDAMQRSVLPSIERDIRRELTERAEGHALDVFARNLRQLLMQPPVARRVLAVDPGIRSGCKVVALDEFGHVLEHSLITILGDDQRKEHSCKKVAEIIRRNELPVVAIGNGTGCREAEQLIADMITEHFADSDLAYVIVNEAGASVYSTSVLAGEELPEYDATLRGAISIGRRLQDPLSELVKIEPSNIGVGLYQHDVKSKPLRQSLDDVVQSCVNYVGVNVNSASPALLAYVSGLNQLTARRVYDHRRTHGPFKTREELKAVPGIGDAVFQQAAGFLKINSGENPLDATWIHPESYEVAKSALDYLDLTIQDFARTIPEAVDVAHSRPAIALQRTKEQFAAGLDRAADTCSNCGGAQQEAATTGEIAATTEIAATAVTETDELVTDAPVTDAPVSDAAESDGESISTGSDSVVSSGELTTGSSAVLGETPVETTTGVAPSVSDAGNAEVGTLREEIASKVRNVDVAEVAEKLSVGKHLLEDILSNLARPGRDPREDLRPPVFRRGIMKLEDLKPGMELTGTVLNVVDFGAFVDIGLSDSGLVHISCLADRYIRDPHEVVGVGDVLRVWVLEVDRDRRRVSLTAIEPGTERPKAERLAEQQQAERSGAGRPRGGRRRPQQGEQTGAAAGGQGRGQGQGGQGRGGQGRSGQGRSGQGRGGQGRSSHGGRPGGAARGGTKVQGKRPPKKVKPVAPITEAMREGREPMRAFSDLLQFYEQSQTTPSVDPSTETPSESPGEETGNE